MAEKKSILEEAMLDVKRIQNAINANTKEILRSAAREEIDGVVKESLMDEVYEEEELETDELGGDAEVGTELGGDADAATADLDADVDVDADLDVADDSVDDLGDMVGPEAEPEMGDDELGMDTDVLGGDDMDMTGASDDEVIAIYKKLSGEDEIEIVGDEIHLNVSEPGEYVVKMAGGAPAVGGEDLGGEELGDDADLDTDLDLDADLGDEESEDDVDYEIELDDEEPEGEEDFEGGEDDLEGGEDLEDVEGEDEEAEEEEIEENSVRSLNNGRNQSLKPTNFPDERRGGRTVNESVNKAKKLVVETAKKYNALLTETIKLQAEVEEYKQAAKIYRNKLVETTLFNENLANVTDLFVNYSTTKAEKDSILKRFDDVKSIKESKKLLSTIDKELKSRTTITESINNKINKGITTSSSKQLNESTAYVDPSTKRILDLINRVERK